MSVKSQIDRIGGEVNTQNALIEQLRTALAGKVGGSTPSGLPEGITALSFAQLYAGETSYQTKFQLPHNLGKTPDFYILFACLSHPIDIDDTPNCVLSIYAIRQSLESEGEETAVTETMVYTDAAGYVNSLVKGGNTEAYFDETTVTINATSTARVRVGLLYYLLAGCYEV